MIKASFQGKDTVSIKYMDTLTDFVIDLEDDSGTVVVTQGPLVMLSSLKGTATVTSHVSPNRLTFHLDKEDYSSLGAGEATVEFTIGENVFVLGVDILPSLLYNKVVDKDEVPNATSEVPIIPALAGEQLANRERLDSLFNDSGYDI